MKYSEKQLKKMIPENSIKRAFFDRADIKELPRKTKEKKWMAHKVYIDSFFQELSSLDCFVI